MDMVREKEIFSDYKYAKILDREADDIQVRGFGEFGEKEKESRSGRGGEHYDVSVVTGWFLTTGWLISKFFRLWRFFINGWWGL